MSVARISATIESQVYCMSATRLLTCLSPESAGAVILDPPAALGSSFDEPDEGTNIGNAINALIPVAEESVRVLVPGGAVLVMGDTLLLSAWDVVASWQALHLHAEYVVLWDGVRKNGYGGLSTSVRWYVKAGARALQADLPIYTSNSNILVCREIPASERDNPSQRPVELFNFFISRLTFPHDLVVDPFCGSGSALVSAEMCERRWVGSDVNPLQVCIANRRVQQHEVEDLHPLYVWRNGRLTGA